MKRKKHEKSVRNRLREKRRAADGSFWMTGSRRKPHSQKNPTKRLAAKIHLVTFMRDIFSCTAYGVFLAIALN